MSVQYCIATYYLYEIDFFTKSDLNGLSLYQLLFISENGSLMFSVQCVLSIGVDVYLFQMTLNPVLFTLPRGKEVSTPGFCPLLFPSDPRAVLLL